MKIHKKIIAVFILAGLLFTGCTSKASLNTDKEEKEVVKVEKKEEKKDIDLQKIQPNEAGQIMVLMYHSIGEPEAEFTRTPDNFRKDLQTLYEKGYRPISLKDYVSGNITTEAGFTPVVLTFDDGWQNNFNLMKNENEEWVIDPDCAVAILEEFHKEHPDFPLEATFFINDNIPFGQEEYLEYKLKYIVEKGMDIGNHTATHVDYKNVDAERIQKELGSIVKLVNKYLPDYEVNTHALPYGSRPKDKSLYKYLVSGSYDGIEYHNIAILNVGWDPYKSPYHIKFDPFSIHRVRGSDLQKYVKGVGMYDWLNHFEKGNRVRYVSDGDPDIVTVPENYKKVIDLQKTGKKKIRTYILKKS
ncbi:polysaccharide deacetylase family protein [Crassaminicella indica]|uniref:Polysaccharide deacetylase family protein n=1 Tax=Crassaminicella indica TaxID=2855394 RepID=A0ABX8RF30_9CLOT|nr:polysaccharide deacetylase family protein [Crassaminicella indica]QXM05556.1 polysaccharide deacetylase family protein [Crassaminicella indica]